MRGDGVHRVQVQQPVTPDYKIGPLDTIQIFVQELTKARREKVAAAHAALDAQAKPA